jgi:phosphatidylglycerophosphate synthase
MSEVSRRRTAWRHVPNAISAARLTAAPVMIGLAATHHETAFAWLLVMALVSDVIDGLLARALNVRSRIGAMLDSAGDVTTLMSAAWGIAVFHPVVFAEHALACGIVLEGWALVCIVALVRYGRLSSFHTWASKAAGYALGFFIAALFTIGFVAPLFYLAAVVSVASSAEELLLLWRLPTWRTDVRGLWWVWREQNTTDPRAG